MAKLLDSIHEHVDVKKIKKEDLNQLCQEIRELLIGVVTSNGGHLASNLGVVELTLALHRVLDLNEDFIVFDVGHQSYVHKILTGRKDQLKSMGQVGGLSCFPDEEESPFDAFNTGHASTSISVGLGMEKSMRLDNKKGRAVALIGDGALGGGMVYEAMNNAAQLDSDILIILNDNAMSISENVGALSRYLSKLRFKPSYIDTNRLVKTMVSKLPGKGKRFIPFIHNIKSGMKSFLGQKMLFEDMGIKYYGPVDGHDIESLENILNKVKDIKGPKLLHVITKKGKGYDLAEQDPIKFHGIRGSSLKSGNAVKRPMYHQVFGDYLLELAKKDSKIVCVCPAMTEGSGLSAFSDEFKDRYFDVGISEQHAVTFSAGLAKKGQKPFCVIYSSFLQRSYDQLIHDVGIVDKKVIICVDRAGVTDSYGKTHQGIYDLAYLSTVPNLTIYAPASVEDMKNLMDLALYESKYAVAIRYPYDEINEKVEEHLSLDLKNDKPAIYNKGQKRAFLVYGRMVEVALEAGLKGQASVVKIRKLYPLDADELFNLLADFEEVICAEDVIYEGSLSQKIQSLMLEKKEKRFKFSSITLNSNSCMRGSAKDILHDNNLSVERLYEFLEK